MLLRDDRRFAMCAVTRTQALGLYRQMLRAGRSFEAYNFREYALRRVREDFHSSRSIADVAQARAAYDFGVQQLELIKRQAAISRMFPQGKHSMEE